MSKEKFKYTKKFLEKVKNGDNDATTLLYEDAKDIAYNKAYSILNNHHDAEDIAEDSVLRAIEKIDTIKKPSEFPAWIRRVAENKSKDYIKKDKPTYMGEDFEYTTNDLNSDQKVLPEKMADSQENIDLYKKLISKLTDDQRNALVLNRIEGYKTREIAEMLGCSENTIKSRIHQGEKKLVKEVESLKKKGYTLNGMMPLDFFTVMSKSLGVTSTNVASVVGATVLKLLSMKIVASVVAVVVVVSGVIGTNYFYSKSGENIKRVTIYKNLHLVPNVVGISAKEAKNTLKSFNIKYKPIYCSSNKYDENYIFNQNPRKGKTIKEREVVTIYISRGADYIIPSSNNQYIKASELKGMSKKELTLALNEIYARYGLMFNTTSVQKYFNSKDWYVPSIKPGHFDDSQFNNFERHNVDTIVNYMKEKGYRE